MIKIIVRLLGGATLLVFPAAGIIFLLQPKIPLGTLSGPASDLFTLLTGRE